MKIKVEKIVYPGVSLGRGDDGIAAFVDGCLPGETVEIAVTRSKKTFKEGKLEAVLEPSPLRITPQCPSFGKCGGCSFQHVSYADQLKFKEGYVRELLSPLGIPVPPVTPSPREWGYRNKMEFSFFSGAEGVRLGLHEKNEFNRYFPVPPCFICDGDFLFVARAVTEFARASGLRAYDKRANTGFFRHLVLRKGERTGQVLANIVTNKSEMTPAFFVPLKEALKGRVHSLYWTINGRVSDAVNVDELILLDGKETIDEVLETCGRRYTFSISPFSFFQTNTLATEVLYGKVCSLLGETRDEALLDLYCGTGTIGIVLSPFVREAHGVEQVEAAVENARENARRNGVTNIAFSSGSVERWIKDNKQAAFGVLVLDPPRGGISNKVVDFIRLLKPRRIVYVSCNPATLARDLALITGDGGYRVREAVPVDLFPQTYHVEVVTALDRA